jgi:hypothetical protein
VNSWETKPRKMEEERNFMYEQHWKNNILIFGIEECPQESYFDTVKITEDILGMKLRVDLSSWHIEFSQNGQDKLG